MSKALCVLWAASGVVFAATTLEVLPPTVDLRGSEDRQQLLAQAAADGHSEDWTRSAAWHSSNPAVATVNAEGVVTPVGDGSATITAKAKGQTASASVRVTESKAPFTWNFTADVVPVLTKMGCNQGACHGALAGKNGFKLTLRGYDPEVDHQTLTRQHGGRRVSLADPPASLLLRKATMQTPHGGGKRFAKDSLEYRVIAEWIAAGAAAPADEDPRVESLEVFPATAILQPGAEQQLVVRARYADGRLRDISRWVKFASSDEGVATVDDAGKVKMTGHGEAAITLWYASKVFYARLSVPFPFEADPKVYSQFPRRNYIDGLAVAKWQALNLRPSPLASDAAFLRRAFLDAAGILPTAEEVEEFLADSSPDKRAKLIDQLLEREEFVDYWSYKWSDLLLVSSRKLRPNAMWSFYHWIRDSVKENKPWDRFARDIFTAQGNTREMGALNYFVLHKDPVELSENVTQAWLGQKLTCARCHNHPLEKWTQTQYYQFANLFSRVGMKNGAVAGDTVVYAKATGDINHPRLLRPLPPTPLDGEPFDLDSPEDRRAHFAAWLTSPDNPYFARALVNRVWGNFMGRGLTEPIDDVRATNPASNEELFAALAADFAHPKEGVPFDVKRLIRTIMNSSVYQLSADANATNQHDTQYYSKYNVKRLPGEVILDAMSQVTGVPSRFGGYAVGTRAMQLPDVRVASPFLSAFGRPDRIICDAGERSSEPSITQALHAINGDTLNRKLNDPNGYAALALKLGMSDARIVEHLYLAAFSRYPTEAERTKVVGELRNARPASGTAEAQRDTRQKALEDMMWALLTSKEFLFNQ
ncbi:MAG: DUF1553 domain-containing protein [Bryobacterales bacterium]|nr:DUF1553 domain-containing protein [Bryobacterales bacterium]